MAIFAPSKRTGDVMGSDCGRRPTKKQRQDFAKAKAEQEERDLCADPWSPQVKTLAQKFEEKVKRDLEFALNGRSHQS